MPGLNGAHEAAEIIVEIDDVAPGRGGREEENHEDEAAQHSWSDDSLLGQHALPSRRLNVGPGSEATLSNGVG
jgi:hypothetical protein